MWRTLLAGLWLVSYLGCAEARLLTWTLDARFDDGGKATGVFQLDPVTNELAPGSTISTSNYVHYDGYALPGGASFDGTQTTIGFNGFLFSGGSTLSLVIEGRLPPNGGSVPLAPGSQESIVDAEWVPPRYTVRNIVSGTITAVPEPGSAAFLAASGIVALMVTAGRKRRKGHTNSDAPPSA